MYIIDVKGLLKGLGLALAKERSVSFAFVYGSFGHRQDARDIDVAVYFRGRGDPWTRAETLAGRLEKALARAYPLDVHALNAASAAFAFEVMSKGRVLFERDRDARLDWEAHALSRYQDLKPMLDFHDRRTLAA